MKDLQKFHQLIEQHEWYEAAVILLRYCDTRDDPQDWLSGGSTYHILSHTLEELAAEFDEYSAS